jgi:hypothetical protein
MTLKVSPDGPICSRTACYRPSYQDKDGNSSLWCIEHGGQLSVVARITERENAELRAWIRGAPHRRGCKTIVMQRPARDCTCGKTQDPAVPGPRAAAQRGVDAMKDDRLALPIKIY